jgi:hypothetical protein
VPTAKSRFPLVPGDDEQLGRKAQVDAEFSNDSLPMSYRCAGQIAKSELSEAKTAKEGKTGHKHGAASHQIQYDKL